jgi:hypothetical protein
VLLMLWSAPRSRSTAFFRMMAERGDFMMVHEPFSYLAEFGYADKAYCARAGIDFRPGALTWQPADRPEWEPSRRWHADVAASTGFTGITGKPGTDIGRHPLLSRYLSYHLPFYEKLHARRLVI